VGAPVGAADGIRSVADNMKLMENVQYVCDGRNYCRYDDGWNGPGWYVCSYGPWVSAVWCGGGGKHHGGGGKGGGGHHGGGGKGGGGRKH
jgi:hypothetical protein